MCVLAVTADSCEYACPSFGGRKSFLRSYQQYKVKVNEASPAVDAAVCGAAGATAVISFHFWPPTRFQSTAHSSLSRFISIHLSVGLFLSLYIYISLYPSTNRTSRLLYVYVALLCSVLCGQPCERKTVQRHFATIIGAKTSTGQTPPLRNCLISLLVLIQGPLFFFPKR